MFSTLKTDLRVAFSRQNAVENLVYLALGYLLTPLFHVYAGLTWPYLIPVGFGLFLLLVAFGIWRRRRRFDSGQGVTPPQAPPPVTPTAVRSRGGSLSGDDWKLRSGGIGLDQEDSEVDVKKLDVEVGDE
jgi:hypothetical protein